MQTTTVPPDEVEQARETMRQHQPDIRLGRRRCIACGEKWDRLIRRSGCSTYRAAEDIAWRAAVDVTAGDESVQPVPHTVTAVGVVEMHAVASAGGSYGGYRAQPNSA